MKYAYVKNDVVDKVRNSLPVSFKNVSNFYLLPESDRNVYGWYNVVLDLVVINDSQRITDTVYNFSNDTVTQVKTVVNKTIDDYKAELINVLKRIFAYKISKDYPIYEQSLAALELLPVSYVINMKADIQVKLDKFNLYKGFINDATDLATLLTYKEYLDTWEQE